MWLMVIPNKRDVFSKIQMYVAQGVHWVKAERDKPDSKVVKSVTAKA